MALEQISFNIASFNDADAGGNNYYAGAVYEVHNLNDTLADIFSDAAGSSPIAQNGIGNVSDSKGSVVFYIDKGSYYALASGERRDFQTSVSSMDLLEQNAKYNPETIAAAIADTSWDPAGGEVLEVQEYYSGTGGGGKWKTIIAGTTPDVDKPNGTWIRQCVGVPTLALVLQVDKAINPLSFGAYGDNTADDTGVWDAISSYIASNPLAINGNPSDEYKITSDINITSDIAFNGNGATFKPIACNGLVIGKAQAGNFATVAADIAINTDNITVDDSSSFSVGDLTKLYSSELWMLDPAVSEDLRKGELNKINRIVGNTIYFEKLITDNYLISGNTITLIKIDKLKVNLSNLNVEFGDSEPRLGIEVRGDDGGKIKNCTVNKAQIQGMNIVNCYKTRVLNHTNHQSNNIGTGYGIQINASTNIKVYNSSFTGCRRGVDISGDIPSRGCDIAHNDVDGAGLASDGSNMPSNSGSSGFGSHETSEFNRFRSNKISGVRSGILLRGKDEVVTDNYFYQDVSISCVQASKCINFTISNNHYVSGLRPGKSLISSDEQQKTPWFVSMTDPAVDGGFYAVTDNNFDDLKNSFMVITLTAGAPFSTLSNMTVTGNKGRVKGTGTGTVYFIESGDQTVTIEDSAIIDNVVSEDNTPLAMYHPDLDVDYVNTVDIDNLLLPLATIEKTTGGTLTVGRQELNLNVKNSVVSINGYIEFTTSVSSTGLKLANLPSKSVVGGSFGPSYSFDFKEGLSTVSAGTDGMIAMPSGVSGTIPTSAWISYDRAAFNTEFPIGTYVIPVSISYYTERRRV